MLLIRRKADETEQKLRMMETENVRLRKLRREDQERFEREKQALREEKVHSLSRSCISHGLYLCRIWT